MTKYASVAKKIWDEFAGHRISRRKKYKEMLSVKALEQPAAEQPADYFSPFIQSHLEAAQAVYEDLQAVAKSAPDELESVWKVLNRIKSFQGKEHPDLLDYVLKIFLLHDVHTYKFQIPSILLREPEMVLPSAVPPGYVSGETRLNWFREDALLNEHHAQWHAAYHPLREIDRHGEMFFYMHRQMLARYEAERLAVGMEGVIAYDDFSKPIATPYEGSNREPGNTAIARVRPANAIIPSARAICQLSMLKTLREKIDSGEHDPAPPHDMQAEINAITRLGSLIEANIGSRDLTVYDRPTYRTYHQNGHVVIGGLNSGVMLNPDTSIRDPVFWEWHKGIDDIYERQIQRLPKHGEFLDAPQVRFKKAVDVDGNPHSVDIILCNKSQIEDFRNTPGANIGQMAFGNSGNDAWRKDFTQGSFTYQDQTGTQRRIDTTASLQTMMKTGEITYQKDGHPETVQYTYLNHEPFCYFLRVENTSAEQIPVTVRVFIVPAVAVEQASGWIEMDKFSTELPPGSKTVLFRDDEEMSVIRKPVVPDPTVYDKVFDEHKAVNNDAKCDCGWPYHLLLPKGSNEGGMAFHFLVMITDGSIDMTDDGPRCGSLSFCAANSEVYPDKRPLGYPFNHSFAGTGILNTIRTNDHMASRQIFIQHKEQ